MYSYDISSGVASNRLVSLKKYVAAVVVTVATLGVTGSALVGAAGDNKQTVTGTTPPCAVSSAISNQTVTASPRTEADGTVAYYLSSLSVRGTINNCSTSLQAYYIDFDEAHAGVPSRFGTPENPGVAMCRLFGASVGDFLMKAGEKKSWSISQDIASEGIIDMSTCVGQHTVTARLIDRTTGAVMDTKQATYNVVIK
jgi:hypothetical protein